MTNTCEYCDNCIEHNGKAFCVNNGTPTDYDKPMCGAATGKVLHTAEFEIEEEPEVYNY